MVSIRFEVRGASRRHLLERGFDGRYSFNPLRGSRCFQTSSMMALTCLAPLCFNPLRGSRCFQTLPHDTLSRQALLRRFYTPPLLTPSNQGTEPVLNGVKPLVKCHTHLRLFLVALQHPCPRVSPRCPAAGSWASSSESTSGRVPSRGAGSGPGRGRVCCSAAGSGFDTAVR